MISSTSRIRGGRFGQTKCQLLINFMKTVRKARIYFESNACNRRELDEKMLFKYFKSNHCSIVKKPQTADIIVLITCGYAMNQVEESIEMIQRLKGYHGKLLVTGCLPGTAPRRLSQEFSGTSLPVKNLNEIDAYFPEFKIHFHDLPLEATTGAGKYKRKIDSARRIVLNLFSKKNLLRKCYYSMKKTVYQLYKGTTNLKKAERKMHTSEIANLIIARGCIGKCSYCAIRFAVGDLRSKSIPDCEKEYTSLLKKGYRLFLLSAEDCGSYGIDIGASLPDLLNRLYEIDSGSNAKWRIQTLSPQWAIKYSQTLKEFVRIGKIQSLKCDLQSGNERILKLMNRFTNLKAILSLLLDLKNINPEVRLHSQFIVGFPSETDEDFAETLSVISKCKFDEVEFFHYTDMEEAESTDIPGKIPESIIHSRMKKTGDWLLEKGYKIYSSSHKIHAIHE